jgi:hypothetical protein
MTWRNNFAWFIVEETICYVITFSKGGGKLIFNIRGDDPLPAHLDYL